MRKFVLWISVLILMSGCKTSLQSNWKNFNAYYNTYYNAEKSYENGLRKNLGQNRDYNPLQPIRIHPQPVNAGAQDFDKAIQKGADVLRRYDDTKWVDDALALIGKSYYFKQEYFSADQKFKELFLTTNNPRLQQEAIVWQGRVLLDMELHAEGTAYLSEQLTVYEGGWESGKRAEVQALLSQHYVNMENWQMAANELTEALPRLPRKEYKERGYFLLGQIHEELGDTESAYEAYDKVQNHYVEYRVQYLAQRKKAEVARDLGRDEVAYRIFNDMVRDDKNLEYMAELDFELARTEQKRGNYKQAEELYKDVLQNSIRKPAPEIAARSYYGLAEIYRFGYDNFGMAAAYYDSAAQKNVPAEKLPENFQANELSESFGNYARIKSEITLQDSLLQLGRLSPEEFDSALVELRAQKLEELEQMRDQQERQQNQLVTVNQEEENQQASNLSNGFLNANNPVIQQNVKMQFLAIWGNRPLADNWRVQSMIRASADEDEVDQTEEAAFGDEGSELVSIQIDLSGIPFTQEAQDSVRKRISAYEYELGNLFFLSLNIPDSAAYYFKKAIEGPSNQNINVVSLYSLSELNSIQGDEDKALDYAQELIQKYPKTEYARRVAEKFDLMLEVSEEEESVDPANRYENILATDTLTAKQKAHDLKKLTYEFTTHKIAPQALYEALQSYMKAGKQDSLYQSKIETWMTLNQRWEQNQSEFQALKDSARAMMQDTTISQEQRTEFRAVVDSTLEEPDFVSAFPYRGAEWDSARAIADTFLVMFNDSKLRPKVTRLKNELEIPTEKTEEMAPVEEPEPVAETPASGYLSCAEIDQELEIRGGMQAFMNRLNLPEDPEIQEITYVFNVNQRGIVEDYQLKTEDAPEDLAREFERVFDREINFEPLIYQGQGVAVECPLTFSITN